MSIALFFSTYAVEILEAVIFVFAASLLVLSLWAGLTGKRDNVEWRFIKLFSTILSFIGFVLLLVTFDKSMREIFSAAKEQAYKEFVDLKMRTSSQAAIACVNEKANEEAGNHCYDYRNIDRHFTIVQLQNGVPFEPVKNFNNIATLQPLVDDVNGRLTLINPLIVSARNADGILDKHRGGLLLLALFLVGLSLAGSSGESAYQFNLANAARQRELAAVKKSSPP